MLHFYPNGQNDASSGKAYKNCYVALRKMEISVIIEENSKKEDVYGK